MQYQALTVFTLTISALCTAPTLADVNDPLFKLLPNDGMAGDQFGRSVAISDIRAIIGAPAGNDEYGFAPGSAYIFNITTAQQLFKLLPSNGAMNDNFGVSVSISGTRAIVGASFEDLDTGAAYLFDTTTGQQLFGPLTNDGAVDDSFGRVVAISGTRAIVGAWTDPEVGNQTGAAYIFDVTTGEQLFKLFADDAEPFDNFGFSVAISGATAVIGAFLDDDNGFQSGSAYIFDLTTGTQLFKLLPDDGAAGDFFGFSVAISGSRAIIGSPRNDDNGSNSGSAYLFDITTGQQIAKFVPSDNAAGDQLGRSVGISSITAIVGAFLDDDNGGNSGSAYLVDATTGQQIGAKLLPNDGAVGDTFGFSVAISSITVIVGSTGDDDNGDISGSAYLTATDTDRDGLLDSWENKGIPYFDKGGALQHFMLPGADPNHKDLFVEIDSMVGLGFAPVARAIVVQAFANAPNSLVDNPDDFDGINLHLIVDEINLPVTPFPNGWVEFDALKAIYFGTPSEAGNTPLLEARAKAYRYCIFGSTQVGSSISGRAEIGGNDIMITLGAWGTPGGTVNQQAGTFMHEFGHTLGLRHFGPLSQASAAELAGPDRHYNLKPNYYSVMNYDWQTPKAWHTPGSWPLAGNNIGYSRAPLNTLNESDLDEIAGLVPTEHAAIYPAPGFLVPFNIETDPAMPPILRGAVIGFGSAVDWNNNGIADPHDPGNLIARDVNRVRTGWPASPGTTLPGHDDWSHLDYDFKDSPDYADGEHTTDEGLVEMTFEDHQALDKVLPPACVGDITLDGTVDVSDLLELFAAWGPCDIGFSCTQDLDESGAVGVSDLLTLFANWGLCP